MDMREALKVDSRLRATVRWIRISRFLYPIFIAWALYFMAMSIQEVLTEGENAAFYFFVLTLVLLCHYGIPYIFQKAVHGVEAEVSRDLDRWRVGRYSEADLRGILQEIAVEVKEALRNYRILIVDMKGTNAYTMFRGWLPALRSSKPLMLTSGSLHYLDRDELKAVILHEIGHHQPFTSPFPPGYSLATLLLIFGILYPMVSGSSFIMIVFYMLVAKGAFSIVLGMMTFFPHRIQIEHFCDLYAAEKTGRVPLINALLKLGEEKELAEIVLARAAKQLLHDYCRYDLEELIEAFEEVRPRGRIFHDNLFKHAAEVVKSCRGEDAGASRSETPNLRLLEFLEKRQKVSIGNRVRWRRFDRDGRGRLLWEEIDALYQHLKANKDRLLVICLEEKSPVTHPSFRDRILLLAAGALEQDQR